MNATATARMHAIAQTIVFLQTLAQVIGQALEANQNNPAAFSDEGMQELLSYLVESFAAALAIACGKAELRPQAEVQPAASTLQ